MKRRKEKEWEWRKSFSTVYTGEMREIRKERRERNRKRERQWERGGNGVEEEEYRR